MNNINLIRNRINKTIKRITNVISNEVIFRKRNGTMLIASSIDKEIMIRLIGEIDTTRANKDIIKVKIIKVEIK